MSTKIIVTGAKGRMGMSILSCAEGDSKIEVVAAIDRHQRIQNVIRPGLVIIDFSNHEATFSFVQEAVAAGCPMVIGTTGFTEAELKSIKAASKKIPMVMAPNMSVGVNLLFNLTRVATSVLKDGFDVEVIEKHHRKKKDSPSGTAARLVEVVADVQKKEVSKVVRHGRQGDVGERTSDEIGVHAIRGGDFVGEHTVIFAGDGEVIEVTHKAGSRDIFARGALIAAQWVEKASPGIYDMQDVLGLKSLR
jgi:4-hydroxy-tetrahydrodipicolinate reductase